MQKDPGHTLAINQGPFMDAIVFRKREHLSERQRVMRTLKKRVSMGPIARVWPGSMTTQPPARKTRNPSPLRSAGMTDLSYWQDDRVDTTELMTAFRVSVAIISITTGLNRAANTCATKPAITTGIFRQILLVILFSIEECRSHPNLSGNFSKTQFR